MIFTPLTVNSDQLNKILNDERLNGAVVSAYICEANGKVLFERDSNRHVMPASNQKLFTASFALSTLGPDYRPKTLFWTQHHQLFIRTEGTPMASSQDHLELAKRLGHRYHQVNLSESYAPGIPDSWEIDDLPFYYAAAIDAFTMDRGTFELWNKHGKLEFRPRNYGVIVEQEDANQPVQVRYDPLTRKLKVLGKLDANSEEKIETLTIPEPDRATASLYGKFVVKNDALPTKKPELIFEDKSLKEAIAACLPPSDNNLAESLLLMASASKKPFKDPTRPYDEARDMLTQYLTQTVGIAPKDIRIFDGSGMSRHNFATTRALGKLLSWNLSQSTAGLWQKSLATPSTGTLRHRLKGLHFAGKTGSLDMVSSLSGYLYLDNGQILVLSLVMNGFDPHVRGIQEIQDNFVKTLSETTR